MTRFLAGSLACLALPAVYAQHLPLPSLPYSYDALAPYIDEATMRVHHMKHHQAYTDKMNAVLARLRESSENKHLAKMGIDKLLQNLDSIVDEADRATIRNNGGGYVNHDLFWQVMSPTGGQGALDSDILSVFRLLLYFSPYAICYGPLAAALADTFGSVDGFVNAFTQKAVTLFGSGWVWLYVDLTSGNARLSLTTTPNQDTPAMTEGYLPILCLDVWEHAYYLKYQNNRSDYVNNWWHVVNWSEVWKSVVYVGLQNSNFVVAACIFLFIRKARMYKVERRFKRAVSPTDSKTEL